MDIEDWIPSIDTSDWISTIAAIVAVIAALASWRQVSHAKDQAGSAKDSLRLQEKIWQDSAQPYVYADIRPDPRNGIVLFVVIENTGNSVAQDVRIKFDPPLESSTEEFKDINTKTVFTGTIPAIPPGARILHYLDQAVDLNEANIPKKYKVTITGKGPLGPLDVLEYELDLNALILEGPVYAEGNLHGLTQAIKELTKQMKNSSGGGQ